MARRGFGAGFVERTWPLVVAHRGDSARHSENTLPAFEAAVRAGADAIELDVRLTADGHAVVSHDADVARTTDGAGPISGLTLDELRRLNAGREGEPAGIPTLQEVLGALAGRI